MTEGTLKTIHVFPSLDSYTTNKDSVGENDLSLIPTPMASQSEAEAGTDNVKLMTPLRTKQAIQAEFSKRNLYVVDAWEEGTEWYRLWSDGRKEQGGRINSRSGKITFKLAFTNTDYTFLTTHYGTLSHGEINIWNGNQLAESIEVSWSGSSASPSKMFWMAVGK